MPVRGRNLVRSVASKRGDVLLGVGDIGGLAAQLNAKPEIDDSSPSTTAVYSSQRVEDATFATFSLLGHTHARTDGTLTGFGTAAAANIGSAVGNVVAVENISGTPLINPALMPSITIADFLGTVASQAAMLALVGERGDWSIRTDTAGGSTTWVLIAEPSSTLGNWKQLPMPVGGVSSVNGLTGAVTLTSTNIAEGTNLYYTDARFDTRLAASSLNAANLASGTTVADARLSANVPLKNAANTFTATQTVNGTSVAVWFQTQIGGVLGPLFKQGFGQLIIARNSTDTANASLQCAQLTTGSGINNSGGDVNLIAGNLIVGAGTTSLTGTTTIQNTGANKTRLEIIATSGNTSNFVADWPQVWKNSGGTVVGGVRYDGLMCFTNFSTNDTTSALMTQEATAFWLPGFNLKSTGGVYWSNDGNYWGTKTLGLVQGASGIAKFTAGASGVAAAWGSRWIGTEVDSAESVAFELNADLADTFAVTFDGNGNDGNVDLTIANGSDAQTIIIKIKNNAADTGDLTINFNGTGALSPISLGTIMVITCHHFGDGDGWVITALR